MKPKYDKEADLLSFRLSKKNYDYATQEGNVIVHYNKDNSPVLIEIVNAAKFLYETNIIKKSTNVKRYNIT